MLQLYKNRYNNYLIWHLGCKNDSADAKLTAEDFALCAAYPFPSTDISALPSKLVLH